MTDVRLTALNPEDSKVYPVACNSSGELITTKSGDINLDVPGNLDVGGNITAAGDIAIAEGTLSVTRADDLNWAGEFTSTNTRAFGVTVNMPNSSHQDSVAFKVKNNGVNTVTIKPDGSATFAEKVGIGTPSPAKILHCSGAGSQAIRLENTSTAPGNADLELKIPANTLKIGCNNTTNYIQSTSGNEYVLYQGGNERLRLTSSGQVNIVGTGTPVMPKIVANADGGCTFAGNKAGLTAEGYLWATTRRGDIVILDATSNGLATWADYTPPAILDVIKDKIKKPGISQELPETQ